MVPLSRPRLDLVLKLADLDWCHEEEFQDNIWAILCVRQASLRFEDLFQRVSVALPPAEEALPAGTVVAVHAEGKEHAAGIGITKLDTEEMKRINKNVGVETIAYLGDDLWSLKTL